MNQTQAEALFRDTYRPIWAQEYGAHGLPDDLTIFPGPDFDGGAIDNMVFIYEGVLNAEDTIVKFAIAHEMSHIVQVRVGQRYGLTLPTTENEASRAKRSEFMSDLFAYHTLRRYLPADATAIATIFPQLQALLGNGDSMHPSGADRVRRLLGYHRSMTLDNTANGNTVLGDLLKSVMT
jgi:hypothetical protein